MTNRSNLLIACLLVTAGLAGLCAQASASSRSFVASYGVDTNSTASCSPTQPCRTFAVALSVLSAGGELVVLDSAGYGPATILQSVSIVAPEGIYAGISVSSGTGITIGAPSANVTLKGLTINGTGGSNGIIMTSGATLTIDHCTIANFTSGVGIKITTPAVVRIADTIVRDNFEGIYISSGATADIVRAQVLGVLDAGIYGVSSAAATATSGTVISVSDSFIAGNGANVSGGQNFAGIFAYSPASSVASAAVHIAVIRSTISNTFNGIMVQADAANAYASVSESMIVGMSGTALVNVAGSGNSVLESFVNNSLRGNAISVSGTITQDFPQ